MPIYMDVHILPGVKARSVAEAHQLDLLHQAEFGCKCMTYWIDEARETVFCLIEAPEKESVVAMHNRAHGLIPHRIIEVNSAVVESFLGRIYDPESALNSDGLKVFHEPSYRVLLVSQTTDACLLRHRLSPAIADAMLRDMNAVIRKNAALHGGREVEHPGTGFIVSFVSAAKAVFCALAIERELDAGTAEKTGLRFGIHGGEPIAQSSSLFGDTIQFAQRLCSLSRECTITISSAINTMVARDNLVAHNKSILPLSPPDEAWLARLYQTLDQHAIIPEFDVDEWCQVMAMSTSQLYRKLVTLTGLSPNAFLKAFRLEKALELMNNKARNITQVTFDAGFNSPSYFTKCFKKKYGILPMQYLELCR